jgi:crotonobetainyl-CoA:carnitine CoA-transferase CaiB-like acyl-CoA transferase
LEDLVDRRPAAEEWPDVTARLATVFAGRPASEWIAELGPQGAAVGPVNAGVQLQADPQLEARRSLVDLDGVVVPGNPIRIGSEAVNSSAPAPAVGQHTRSLLLEAGCSSTDVDALVAEGVVSE